jgi:uncharacterized membrane protein
MNASVNCDIHTKNSSLKLSGVLSMASQPENNPFSFDDERNHYRDSGIVSTVSIAKHPLHPAIVSFPIALLSAALGTDIAYFLSADTFWARSSQWLLVAGLLSGLVAAATGTADFLKIKRVRNHRAGWLHMFLNTAALILTLGNILIRLYRPEQYLVSWGLLISAVVATLLAVSGWFGGELTFRHKVGVIGASRQDI